MNFQLCSARLAAALALPIALVSSSPAQQPSPLKRLDEISVILQDGSVFRGKLDIKSLEVETPYGKLVVPASDVIRIRVGKSSNKELKTKIEQYIADLGSKDFQTRETAQKELAKLGKKAYAEIEAAARSDDAEVATRATALLAEMDTGDDEEIQPADDEIITPTLTLRGVIKMDAISLQTRYGTLKVDKKDIIALTLGQRADAEKIFKLTDRNTSQSQWLDTGIRVKRGDRIVASATGSINWVNSGYVTEPRGNPQIGQWTRIGNQPVFYGALVGRIGQGGQMFLMGDKFNDKAIADGNLFIAVGCSWGPQNATGEYKVRIEVRPAGTPNP
jgi:hypothetical protein